MPVVRPLMLGGSATISPPCNLRRTIVLADDTQVATSPLLVEGLPNLFLWGVQTTIGAVAVMEWQWSARAATGALGVPDDDWQLVYPAATTVLVPFVVAQSPVFYGRAMSAKRLRVRLQRAPGVDTTVELFYGGTH